MIVRRVRFNLAAVRLVVDSEFYIDTEAHRQHQLLLFQHVDYFFPLGIFLRVQFQLKRSLVVAGRWSDRYAIVVDRVFQFFVQQQHPDDIVIVVVDPFADHVGAAKLDQVAIVGTVSRKFSVVVAIAMIVTTFSMIVPVAIAMIVSVAIAMIVPVVAMTSVSSMIVFTTHEGRHGETAECNECQ